MKNLREHPGWTGVFSTDRAEGAMPNGTRVWKHRGELGDVHPMGDEATVLGSIGHPDFGILYFVEWDRHKRMAALVVSWKITPKHPVKADRQEA